MNGHKLLAHGPIRIVTVYPSRDQLTAVSPAVGIGLVGEMMYVLTGSLQFHVLQGAARVNRMFLDAVGAASPLTVSMNGPDCTVTLVALPAVGCTPGTIVMPSAAQADIERAKAMTKRIVSPHILCISASST